MAHLTPEVKAIFVLDNEGYRVCAKYYGLNHLQTNDDKLNFEARVFKKTKGTSKSGESDIVMLDQLTILYRVTTGCIFYVVGEATENEIILCTVLDSFVDVISSLLRGSLDR